MNKFIRKVVFLLISGCACFNSSFALGESNVPIVNMDPLFQARSECSKLLNNGTNVHIIFCRDNDDSPNSCFIMGGQKFLMWNANGQTCQWIRCRTLIRYIISSQNDLNYVWDASKFSDLDINPLSETEVFGFASSFPLMNNLVNYNCHSHSCNHEHQPVEQQYPN